MIVLGIINICLAGYTFVTLGKVRTVRAASGMAASHLRAPKPGALEHALLVGKGPHIISFVGSGGKTSLLKALALHCRRKRLRVLATTTTHVRVSEFDGRPFFPVKLKDATRSELLKLASSGKIPFIFDGREPEKFKGVRPSDVPKVGKGFDAVLVEADGCRGLPLKRLRNFEPPLPSGGSVVLVVGADVSGKRLEDGCFNSEGAVAQCLARKGQSLDGATIRRILFHPRGFLDAAGHRPLFLALNKRDIFPGAEALARELYHSGLAGVFVTSVRKGALSSVRLSNTNKRVIGLVLAGGESRRFGSLKQAAPYRGTTLLGAVVKNALGAKGLERVLLVLGHRHKEVRRSLGRLARHPRLGLIVNDDYHRGMSTSLRAGVRLAGNADAVAIILGDQPGIDSATIDRVLDAYRSSPCKLAFPISGNKRGHPVILGRELFPVLRTLEGDVGARSIVEENRTWAANVSVPSGTQADIDVQKDLKRHGAGGKR
jgi:probable selenium-dependent hydroxylase accessory protein YqeC